MVQIAEVVALDKVQSQRKMRVRFHGNDGRLLIDPEGRVGALDFAFTQTFGYSERDLEGQTLSEIITSSSKISVSRAFAMKVGQFIIKIKHKNGDLVSCIFQLGEVRAEGGLFRVLRLQRRGLRQHADVIRLHAKPTTFIQWILVFSCLTSLRGTCQPALCLSRILDLRHLLV